MAELIARSSGKLYVWQGLWAISSSPEKEEPLLLHCDELISLLKKKKFTDKSFWFILAEKINENQLS